MLKALADSNKELERFAYIASHDLQEPIRMINNFSKLILSEKHSLLDEEAMEYLELVIDSGERMRDMIHDLLAYSRVSHETIKCLEFDANIALKNALTNIDSLIKEHKAEITYDNLPNLYGNVIQFMRLFQNLLTNSIKYQPLGNIPRIHISVEKLIDAWQISIQDNGLGIEHTFIKTIFEPFQRLHSWEKFKGSGLGLTICKKIVELHHGTLTVSSEKDKGSCFYIIIPFKQGL